MAYALEAPWNETQRVFLSTLGDGWTNGARQQIQQICFSKFCVVYFATTDHTEQPSCLKQNSSTTQLVRSELITLPSRLILGSLLRSPPTCCSSFDQRFQFFARRVRAIKIVARGTHFGTFIVIATQGRDASSFGTVDSPALRSKRQVDHCYKESLLTWTT
jgi:hypothetical protein